MNTYARLDSSNAVAELITTASDPATLFNPALQWREVTTPGVAVGWIATATGFTAPPPPAPSPSLTPSLAELQAELTALTSRIAAFTATSGG
jgi:hypothetical protein